MTATGMEPVGTRSHGPLLDQYDRDGHGTHVRVSARRVRPRMTATGMEPGGTDPRGFGAARPAGQ